MLFLVVSTPRPERPSDLAEHRQSFWPWMAKYEASGVCRHVYARAGRGAIADPRRDKQRGIASNPERVGGHHSRPFRYLSACRPGGDKADACRPGRGEEVSHVFVAALERPQDVSFELPDIPKTRPEDVSHDRKVGSHQERLFFFGAAVALCSRAMATGPAAADVRYLQGGGRRRRPPPCRSNNAERIVKEGYRFLMCAPVRSYGHLDAARKFGRQILTVGRA